MEDVSLRWWPHDRWPVNEPEPLLDLCLQCMVSEPQILLRYDDTADVYYLRDGIIIPPQLCERLLLLLHKQLDTRFLYAFCDTERTKLKRLDLLGYVIQDESLERLMAHRPRELHLGNNDLSHEALQIINMYSENLTSLYLWDFPSIFSDPDYFDNLYVDVMDMDDESLSALFHLPRIQTLAVRSLPMNNVTFFVRFDRTLATITSTLVHLDLSECDLVYKPFVQTLGRLTNLQSLILYDHSLINIEFSVLLDQIKKLTKLRLLDLSQSGEEPLMYSDPEITLKSLVDCLPELTHLDLSGTNLPGFIRPKPTRRHSRQRSTSEDYEEDDGCSIPGLEDRHLQFLGLLNCPYEACQRKNIPANEVTGDANESQILLSIQRYYSKTTLLLKALNNLFQLCRYSECTNQRAALRAILRAMRRDPKEKTIQISGSASMFYICKSDDRKLFSSKVKRTIIEALLDGMQHHHRETTMLRNGCLTLCHFSIPQDVLFAYRRVVELLLMIVRPADQEEFVQHVGIFLLNSLACQVDGHEKQLVGDLGAIETMLEIIESRLSLDVCDEVLEIAWSTMWNVTDETAVNCERFIKGNGMDLFLRCLQKFSDKEELLRNMMGLLGNVAEVESLRCYLMKPQYISIFSSLLDSNSDGIEVSYNACGVLAHLVSDGAQSWSCPSPSRLHVLQKMTTAISKWKLDTKRNINYRSFEPILRLLSKFETPEAQHWATWALCNLTKVYRKKYCALVEREHGVELLEAITEDPRPLAQTKALAYQVILRCKVYSQASGDESETEGEDADRADDIMDEV